VAAPFLVLALKSIDGFYGSDGTGFWNGVLNACIAEGIKASMKFIDGQVTIYLAMSCNKQPNPPITLMRFLDS